MRGISSLSFTLAAIVAATVVQAAPAKTEKLTCASADPAASLFAGDYLYGTASTKLGYKSVTTSSGSQALYVVDRGDGSESSIKPFIVHRAQCNSTALNYFSHPGQYGANSPIKLFTDVVIDNKAHCVGLNAHHTTAPSASDSKTHVALVPCAYEDDAYTQSNQFWLAAFKFNFILPLIGPSPSKRVQSNNTWPIYPPASNANPAEYRAGPKKSGNDEENAYRSFVTSSQ